MDKKRFEITDLLNIAKKGAQERERGNQQLFVTDKKNTINSMVEFVLEIRNVRGKYQVEELEFEIRLGHLVLHENNKSSFSSSISETLLDSIVFLLSSDSFWEKETSCVSDFRYLPLEKGGNGSRRVSFDERSKRIIGDEMKGELKLQKEIQAPEIKHVLRCNLTNETERSLPPPSSSSPVPLGYNFWRRKNRVSFSSPKLLWKIEATKVFSSSVSYQSQTPTFSPPSPSFELEFEFQSKIVDFEKTDLDALFSQFWETTCNIILLAQKSKQTSPRSQLSLPPSSLPFPPHTDNNPIKLACDSPNKTLHKSSIFNLINQTNGRERFDIQETQKTGKTRKRDSTTTATATVTVTEDERKLKKNKSGKEERRGGKEGESRVAEEVKLKSLERSKDFFERKKEVLEINEKNYFKKKFLEAFGIGNASKYDWKSFPGTLPVALRREQLEKIRVGKYWVSEKTDGTRYSLFLSYPEKRVFLVDRKFNFYELPSCENMSSLFCSKGSTLFDGEVVQNLERKEMVFMIFDILSFEGEKLKEKPLLERLQKVAKAIDIFRKNQEKFCFELIAKNFYKSKEISQLLQNITKGDHNHNNNDHPQQPFYRDKRRFHLTDGIIFTPPSSYQFRCDENLFKWKFPELISVDFKLSYKHEPNPRDWTQNLWFVCGGKGEDFFFREFSFSQSDTKKLKLALIEFCNTTEDPQKYALDLPLLIQQKAVIVECFVTKNGEALQFSFYKIRTDKHIPNFVTVVQDTISSAEENITIQDIVSYCTK